MPKHQTNLHRQERALRTHVEVLLRDDMRQVGLVQPDAKEERLPRPLDPNTRPREVADGLHAKRRNLAVRMFKIGDVLEGGGGGVGDVAAGAGLDRQLDAVGAHPDGRVRVREVPETTKRNLDVMLLGRIAKDDGWLGEMRREECAHGRDQACGSSPSQWVKLPIVP